MGKKLVLIGLPLVCLLCLLVGFGFYGMFGYLELNDECKYTGPFASVPEDSVCFEDENDSEDNEEEQEADDDDEESRDEDFDGEVYTATYFRFTYPSDWFIDDSTSVLYLYAQDPDSLQDFYENINMQRFTQNDLFKVNDSTCEEYGEGVVSQLTDIYDTVELTDSDSVKVDGMNACEIEIEGTAAGTEIVQTQFYAVDNDNENVSYIITLTYQPRSSTLNEMLDVVRSFELR